MLLKRILLLPIALCTGVLPVAADTHDPGEQVSDWRTSLAYLKAGNKRYMENRAMKRNTTETDRAVLKSAQKPFAVVVTCSDSRLSPEIIFDQKLGDIFVIRNAGNIVDTTTLGSVEYAIEHLKVPLVVVMGHDSCGAVNGAYSSGEYSENLQTIIDSIRPVIGNCENLDAAIRRNAGNSVVLIKDNEIVRQMGATVMSAHHNIGTGEVTFY